MKKKYLSLLLATLFTIGSTTVFANEYNPSFENMEVVYGIDENGEETITFTVPKEEMDSYFIEDEALAQTSQVSEPFEAVNQESEQTELYGQYTIGQCVGYARAGAQRFHQNQFNHMENGAHWTENYNNNTQTRRTSDEMQEFNNHCGRDRYCNR